MMDSAVRIPFTKQGIGADAALSTIPIAGDVAGFALTCYAIYKAKQIGVPQHKLTPVIKLAVVDAVVGFVPVAGTIFDIFIRPSRKALDVVHTHIREEYAIQVIFMSFIRIYMKSSKRSNNSRPSGVTLL